MAGTDTTRGISFQHAVAIEACLEALESEHTCAVRVEGTEDIVDVEVLDADDRLVWAWQVKARQEPATWGESELLDVLRRWFAVSTAQNATFTFVTDGQLGRSGSRLREIVNAVARGENHPELQRVMTTTGEGDASVFANVRIRTRAGTSEALLERAELQLLRLAHDQRRMSATEAHDRINSLFREISLTAGRAHPRDRTLSVDKIRTILGLRRARPAASCRPSPPTLEPPVPGTASTAPPPALLPRSDHTRRVLTSLQLDRVDRRGRVALWGAPGFGKTTIAETVNREVLEAGYVSHWITAGPTTGARQLIMQLIRTLDPVSVTDEALHSLVLRLWDGAQGIDLLICDDVWSAEAVAVLASALPPDVGLLVTTGSRDAVEDLESIPVEAISPDETLELLRHDVPEPVDLGVLVEAIAGWPLLLDLVRRSIRRHVRAGVDVLQAVAIHAERLTAAGPTAFDRREAPARSNATTAALDLALAPLSEDERNCARRLAILQTTASVEFEMLETIWDQEPDTALATALALDEVALLRVDVSTGQFSAHAVLIRALSALSSSGEFAEFNSQFVKGIGNPKLRRERYVAEHFLTHLVLAGRSERAVGLLLARDWLAHVRLVAGSAFELARQAHEVASTLSKLAVGRPLDHLVAWLVTRMLAARMALDHNVAGLLARTHGVRLTEEMIRAGGDPHQSALAYAELASVMVADGRRLDAERNVRSALQAAVSNAELGIPDTVILTAVRLGAAQPGWALSALEALQQAVGAQDSESNCTLARAVAAGELLFVDPDAAITLAAELLETVQDAVAAGKPLEVVLGDDAEAVLRNVLPLLGYLDYEMGIATLESIEDSPWFDLDGALEFGGPLLGLAITDASRALEELDRTPVGPTQEHAVLSSAVVCHHVRAKRFDDAELLISRIASRSDRAHLYCVLGAALHRAGRGDDEVERSFKRGMALLPEILDPSALLATMADCAAQLIEFDPQWGEKVAQQVLNNLPAVGSDLDRINVETRAVNVLASIDPSNVPAKEAESLITRASNHRSIWVRGPISETEAFTRMAGEVQGAALDRSARPPYELIAPLREAQIGGGIPYWAAWARRLSTRLRLESDALAAVFNDPDFGSANCYFSGTTARYIAGLVETERADELPELWTRYSSKHLRELVIMEGLCSQAALRKRRPNAPALANLETVATRSRAIVALDAIEDMHCDKVGTALNRLADLFRADWQPIDPTDSDVDVRSDASLYVPDAISEMLRGRLAFRDLRDLSLGALKSHERAAFGRYLLERIEEVAVHDVLEWARDLQLDPYAEREFVSGALADVATHDAAAIIDWLNEQLDDGSFLDGTGARILHSLLRGGKLPTGMRAELEQRSREALRHYAEEYRVSDDAYGLRIVADVAPYSSAGDAIAFARSVTSPWLVGPALCFVAARLRRHGDSGAVQLFVEGLKEGRRSVGDAMVPIARASGEALSVFSVDSIPLLAAGGALEVWPGGLTGLYLSLGAMAPALVDRFGAGPLLSTLHRLGDLDSASIEQPAQSQQPQGREFAE